MTITEVARITVLAEQTLSELTDMSAMDRMEFLSTFQSRLIGITLNESTATFPGDGSTRPAPARSAETGRGFQLHARTVRAVPMVDAIDNVLRTLLPHGDGL